MASILIFGASGPVGRLLLPQMTPHRVLAVSRRQHAEPGWVRADLGDTGFSWPAADIVLSLGPLDAFAAWLERQTQPAPRRVIALSSMSAQSKRGSADPAERDLAERLLAAEARVGNTCASRGIAWTLFRPTLIYGLGSDRSLAPIARFMRRWRLLPLPMGAVGLRQPVHARDLAAACLAALDNAATYAKTYPLGGGESLPFNALLRRMRDCAPGYVLPLPLPAFVFRGAGKFAGFSAAAVSRLRESLVADNTEAMRDFGYAPAPFQPRDVLPD